MTLSYRTSSRNLFNIIVIDSHLRQIGHRCRDVAQRAAPESPALHVVCGLRTLLLAGNLKPHQFDGDNEKCNNPSVVDAK